MNRKRLRVSIVIPAYNEERHLKECLESIARQTVAPSETIVVDNNSTDRTADIARSFPFVTLVRERRQGIVFARDAGFDAATGDIIGRIDADTRLPRGWVAHIGRFFSLAKSDEMAWTGTGRLYDVRMPRLMSIIHTMFMYRFSGMMAGGYTLWGSNMAITIAQWRAVRSQVCRRTDIHEDLDLTIHLKKVGYRVTLDMTMPVEAELKRFQDGRGKLWEYLSWLPKTLKLHGSKRWLAAWVFGVVVLYYASYGLVAADTIGRLTTRIVRRT